MKKIYLFGLATFAVLTAGAQATYKISKKEMMKGRVSHLEKVAGPSVNPMQITGTIVCNTLYSAGTTQTLNMLFTMTNTDQEYFDYLEITFPAGITPTGLGTTSNPFPNTFDPGGGLEALNGVNGQTISWGDAAGTDEYGGIATNASGIAFNVEVTTAAGTTGNQTATWSGDGDGFNLNTGGVGTTTNGSFIIYPAGTPIVDLTTTFVQPLNLTALNVCNYGSDTVVAQIKNLGTTTESNISVVYSVNGVAQPATVFPGPLAPGDSSYIFWASTFDFSATGTYTLKAWTAQASDISAANDTTSLGFYNQVSIPLTNTTYTNGIETTQEIDQLGLFGNASNYTGLSGGTFHTGAQALFTTVGTAEPAGTYEVKIILPCMDVVAGETYRISYWRKVNNNVATHQGSGGIFTGLTNDGATMTNIKPYSTITPTGAGAINWSKDSVDYVASASETRYFAIGGQGTVNSTTSFNFRVDDINISKVNVTTGIASASTLSNVLIFPNPSEGVINVRVNSKQATVEVYDVIGNSVAGTHQLINGNNVIDLNNLSSGVYFVRVNEGGKIVSHKLNINK